MNDDVRSYPLIVERDDDGSYVVSDDATLVYGWGKTLEAALADYDVSLIEWRALNAADDERRSGKQEEGGGDE